MAIRNDLNAEIKTDIINYNGASNGQAYILLGETTLGDTPYRLYYYSSTSTATADGENILSATGMGTGRFIKVPVQEAAVTPRTQASASRSLNTIFQVDSTRDSLVNYSVDISCALTLSGGATGTVFLEISPSSTFASGVQEVGRFVNGNTGTLTVGISITQSVTGTLSGYVPAGYYVRIRTANTSGTPTFTYISGQEVSL